MTDIATWLEEIGLGKYAQNFADNEVDLDLLPHLSEQDLKELGLPVGPRRRLQQAISEGAGREEAAAEAPAPTATPAPAATPEGERRQVTVLFADLTGFTALSRELGAEQTHALLNRYFAVVDGIVQAYGGTIDKHIGDSVMSVFGAPVAHTDDPERAVRAARDIHEAMTGLSEELGRELSAHVGIASGQVVASGTGSDAHREYTVTGDTVNLASRLGDLAGPKETLVTQAVQQAVSHHAGFASRGEVEVKGFAAPLPVWRLEDLASGAPPQPERQFVGRKAELGQLGALLDDVLEQRRGQSVLIRGEPGIGKSRLLEECTRLAAERGFLCHKGLVLDFGVGKGQDAVRALVRSLLDIPLGSGKARRRQAAEEACAAGLVAEAHSSFLFDLLDLPLAADAKALYDAMENRVRNEGKLATVAELVASRSREAPILLMVEDIHWAAGLTMAHLAKLAATAPDCALLLVMTSRVEGQTLEASWIAALRNCPLTTIELRPLRADEAMLLARGLAEDRDGFHEKCVARSEGNPLFLEQLLRNLSEDFDESLPDTILSVVLARMDRLDARDREALQCAAVLGQRFDLDTLRALLEAPDYDIAPLVTHLLVRPEGEGLLFAHALIRDGAYSSLLTVRRRALHQRAAQHYAERDPALRAEHLDLADDPACTHAYLAAARLHSSQFHVENALRLIDKGLRRAEQPEDRFGLHNLKAELERTMGDTSASLESSRQAIEASYDDKSRSESLIGLAASYRLQSQYDDALEVLAEAEQALGDAPEPLIRSTLHHLRGNLLFASADAESCRRNHELALSFAKESGSPEAEANALSGLGDAAYMSGRMIAAERHFTGCVEICSEHGYVRTAISNVCMLGLAKFYDLRLAEADSLFEAAHADTQRISHSRGKVMALGCKLYLPYLRGDWRKTAALASELGAEQERLGMTAWGGYRLRHEALAIYAEGRCEEARAQFERAVAMSREGAAIFDLGRALSMLALFSTDPEETRDLLDEGEASLEAKPISHNFLWFYRDGMFAAAGLGDWGRLRRFAAGLESFVGDEAVGWSDYHAGVGRALADLGENPADEAARTRLEALRARAEALDFHLDGALLSACLQGLAERGELRVPSLASFALGSG